LNKKRPLATITLSTEVSENVFSFTFRDDGRGIQIDKLRQLAMANEKYPWKEIENWGDRQIAQLIFEPEFTTAEEVNQVAGRGIGLDIIYQKIIKQKGNIELNFEKGNFCEFKVSIPLKKIRKISVNRNKKTNGILSNQRNLNYRGDDIKMKNKAR
jgi:two-component system chemotaxis sensor kinase CheA